VLPRSVIELLGQLEELDCSSKSSSGQVGMGMLFPPAAVWNGGLCVVRAFFCGDAVDISLKGAGIRVEDVDDLVQGLAKVAVRSMDLSENRALGTSGAARLVGGLGRRVKSLSLTGTGLGLAAGQVSSQQAIPFGGFGASSAPVRLPCSGEDWTILEGALGGLAALEAIDLSENGALGTSGAARLVGGLGRGVKSVSLKGTGLRLSTGQGSSQQAMPLGGFGAPVLFSFAFGIDDFARLEGALGGLAALEAIDLSENGALGTSGVGRLVSSCSGELISFVSCVYLLLLLVRDVVLQRACAG